MIDEILLLEIMDHQGWKFPLCYPLILDSKRVDDWNRFQLYLRLIQYINQDGKCVCRKELDDKSELHHALISRRDALGLPQPEMIHHSYNVLLVHKECHKGIVRFDCLTLLSEIFGQFNVEGWYRDVKSTMVGGFRNT